MMARHQWVRGRRKYRGVDADNTYIFRCTRCHTRLEMSVNRNNYPTSYTLAHRDIDEDCDKEAVRRVMET
jgi:cytochrome c553